jgi:HlyD family secretion protein
VVFAVTNNRAVMKPVTRGISDESHTEIVEGLEQGMEIITGGYRAINRDLEDGKVVRVDNKARAVTQRDGEQD